MKNFVVIGVGAVGAFAVSAALGSGVAAADDYAGQSYSDASTAASQAGKKVIVAARVGDQAAQDACLVTRSQTAPFNSANDGKHVSDTVQFYLNCNAGVASATKPGNSLASPAGRTAKAAEDEAAAKEASTLEQSSTPDQ